MRLRGVVEGRTDGSIGGEPKAAWAVGRLCTEYRDDKGMEVSFVSICGNA